MAAMKGMGPYGKLSPEEKAAIRYETFLENNPTIGAALRRAGAAGFGANDDYGLGNELLGTADAHRCFAKGSASGCVWLAVGLTPGKLFKLAKPLSRLSWLPWVGKACSFSGDTLVLMADGTTKPISQVRPGERVVASDPSTGERTVETVLAVWQHDDTLVQLQLAVPVGQPGASITSGWSVPSMDAVTTTADHPYWNHTDQRWQPAVTLDPGDRLLTTNTDRPATVVGLLLRTQYDGIAYNLTTTNTHTYHVRAGASSAAVLVHNACLREQYVSEVRALAQLGDTMRANGASSELVARTLHAMRRTIGQKYKDLTPSDLRLQIYSRNIDRYGDPLGPSVGWLRSQGKSWEQIAESATRPGGQDLGF